MPLAAITPNDVISFRDHLRAKGGRRELRTRLSVQSLALRLLPLTGLAIS